MGLRGVAKNDMIVVVRQGRVGGNYSNVPSVAEHALIQRASKTWKIRHVQLEKRKKLQQINK